MMAVYVDDMRAAVGRLILCHMVADTLEELHAMADAVQLNRKWFQGDHYDICLTKRRLALQRGAIAITIREAARMVGPRRRAARRTSQ